MTKIARFCSGLTAIVASSLMPIAAQASDNQTYVASTGNDANPCTLASPCLSFQAAHDQTFDNGQISCADSGRFAGATIAKSITIDCAGTSATAPGGFSINGSGIVVTLRNLTISGNSNNGVVFSNGAALFIENVTVANMKAGGIATSAIGVFFRPSAPGSQLVVTDTLLKNNGSGTLGGGIVISPQSGGDARVALNRVTVSKNVFGIVADGTGSTGGINMTISDSVSTGNTQDGIIAVTPSGGAPIGVMVKNTRSTNNTIGVRSIGPNVTVRVDGSTIVGNGTGVSFSGGALLTFGNNDVVANGTNGAFSGSVGLQ